MKRLLISFLLGIITLPCFQATAQNFEVPPVEMLIPLDGRAQLLNNWVQVTWGYYPLRQVTGKSITATVTDPNGDVMTVKGTIQDANAEGTQEKDVPATTRNSLAFSGFQTLNWDTMLYEPQLYGTWKLEIPAGIVMINNAVTNPAVEMEFVITGVPKTMPLAWIVSPTSEYVVSLTGAELTWDTPIKMAGGLSSVEIPVAIDGFDTDIAATAQLGELLEVAEGEEPLGMTLLISLEQPITYEDGSLVDFLIPEGIVENQEGEVNQSQTPSFSLFELIEGTVNPETESTIAPANAQMTVRWPGALRIQKNGDSYNPILVTPLYETMMGSTEVSPYFPEDADYVEIDLYQFPDGKYEVSIPQEYFLILLQESDAGDIYALSKEITVEYTIGSGSGVNSIDSSDKELRTFDLQGRPIENPEKGIFIERNRKVIK